MRSIGGCTRMEDDVVGKLVNGKVPANTPCPFSDECMMECPCNGKPCTWAYSCALARSYELSEELDEQPESKTPLRRFREKNAC